MFHRFVSFITGIVFVSVLFSVGCSAQQTEEQALESLRQLTKDGKLPAESVVEQIERRFSGRQTGVLARLLRARIKFESKDFAGAASLLDTNDFATKTKLGDYALWMRGHALQSAGNYQLSMSVLSRIWTEYPNSVHIRQAKLAWATAARLVGRSSEVPAVLSELTQENDETALLYTAKAFHEQGSRDQARLFYRRAMYVSGFALDGHTEFEQWLKSLGYDDSEPRTSDELLLRADSYFKAKKYFEAGTVYTELSTRFPKAASSTVNLKRLSSYVNAKRMPEAQSAFISIPATAPEKEKAYYELATGYAKNKLWPQAKQYAEEMRQTFPDGKFTPKAWVDAGYAARDAKNKGEENYFLRTAVAAWPAAVEVAGAQFELAWLEHESKNYARASEMMIEHLARYADKDTTNRGKAGYWAARNAELAGRFQIACTLYETVIYRYSANWYGYLAQQRLGAMKPQGKCAITELPGNHTLFSSAIANLKTVTVAAETSGPKELERAEKSDQLSTVGLFDWAIDELNEAKKKAQNSPKINLALARHYRMKSDNVSALLALAKSYPDYSQMFPEEMGRKEWEIFYPLTNWDQIAAWAKNRNLDHYQVAGLIRQESVFNARAKSPANAYGLMQLILPTARSVARKYGSTASISIESLFLPALNIELGTAYMRDQLDKFGRIEYMAVAYNAGPGRVPQWRSTLPLEIDEFVEEIPFKETKAYVQGVIRNSAQYRRLYDENGNFKPNVGSRPLRGEIDSLPRDKFTADFPDVAIDDGGASE